MGVGRQEKVVGPDAECRRLRPERQVLTPPMMTTGDRRKKCRWPKISRRRFVSL
jgi:hypothetical protein